MDPVAAQTRNPSPLPVAEMQLLATTYQMLHEELAQQKSKEALILGAIRGMIREVDPESGDLLDEEQLRELRAPVRRAALGLELVKRGQDVIVAGPVVGGPAEAAGLRTGDVLLRIDEKKVAGLSSNEASRLLRGEPGTKGVIAVRRGADTLTFSVERAFVNHPAAKLLRPHPEVALLQVPYLGERTLAEVAALLRAEFGRDPPKAMVLDLRRNLGGLPSAAAGMVSVFLAPGTVVARQAGRASAVIEVMTADRAVYAPAGRDPLADLPVQLKSIPLAVLVGESTASSAELIAAALKDHGRAVLVGRRTFGRASIQTLTPLDPGFAIKYTTAYWLSPSGQGIHRIGVQPQHEVRQGEEQLAVELLTRR